MEEIDPFTDPRVLDHVRRRRDEERAKPLAVAVVGQTGVGKSSLLNALFGTDLVVGDVLPTTKIPEPVEVVGSGGHTLTFWDMPGFGESARADAGYLDMYREKLLECDVLLWGIHADSRSTTFEVQTIDRLLDGVDEQARRDLMSKLTFVLTKADLVARPPWVYAKHGRTGTFAPSKVLDERLAEKARYFERVLIAPHAEVLSSRTFNDCSFPALDPRFTVDDNSIVFTGYFDVEVHRELSRAHGRYRPVFDRLRENHEVAVCSSAFRYGLVRLLSIVVNKIGVLATGRFERLVGGASTLDEVGVDVMRKCAGFVVYDTDRRRVVFDLDEFRF